MTEKNEAAARSIDPDGGILTLFMRLTFALLALIIATLWGLADRTYFVKSLTESHNIILTAANVRDLLTFLVQDVAASPDPAAHPFWYIHNPNLPAKAISLALSQFGLGLEGQVGVMLALNVAGLAAAVAAFSWFSRAAALAALLIAATSYGSFHYSAGDLCRGPLNLMLWPFLYGLFYNETLRDRGKNVITGSVAALSILSDWGFALFILTLAFGWGSLGRGRPPWRWYLLVVALPAAAAFTLYEAAVISVVGWDFFLLDARVTYLGRLGIGNFIDYLGVIDHFRENSVVVWPAQGRGTLSLLESFGVLVIKPMLNTGPAWILLMPTLACGAAITFARIKLGRMVWFGIAILVALNLIEVLPLPILLPIIVVLACGMARVPVVTTAQRLSGLAAALVLAVMAPAVIFPGLTIGFTIQGGRPPFPLLEMGGAALLMEIAFSGQLARWLTRLALTPRPVRRLFLSPSYEAWTIAGLLIVTGCAVFVSEPSMLGISRDVALGITLAMVGGPLIGIAESRAYIRSCIHYPALAAREDSWVHGLLKYWEAGLLGGTTLVLSAHVSEYPAILGRYSLSYAAFLAVLALLSVLLVISAAFPSSSRAILTTIASRLRLPNAHRRTAASPAAICVQMAIMVSCVAQGGWFLSSVAAHPPKPIPYAALLAQPEYRGKSFLTTSYDGIVWNSTGGWAYMSPSNPPRLAPISSRFRHFADWRNEAKYSHPDYFLCDNTSFSFVPPDAAVDGVAAGPSCRDCTCKDVDALLRAEGHEVVVDRSDFSIVKMRW
jgi:hypothetical protein